VGSKITVKSLSRKLRKWLNWYGWELEEIKDRLAVLELQVTAIKKELEEKKNASK